MSQYRKHLPFNAQSHFITDAGLETELVFRKEYDLPEFASFPLLESQQGMDDLTEYFMHYLEIARTHNTGIVLESPTWRANPDWVAKLNYDAQQLREINHKAIAFMESIREQAQLEQPCLISGCIGPRYDGYNPEQYMSTSEAEQYHCEQIASLAETTADMITAMTITSISEGCGITLAAKKYQMPVVISFTTETDGKLPSGETLKQAIEEIDDMTGGYPTYYMINCAHPTHFEDALNKNESWLDRIGGLRANASCKSHAELDESTELDAGNPQELGQQYRQLQRRLHNLNVVGGCCGTNHQHVAEITQACFG